MTPPSPFRHRSLRVSLISFLALAAVVTVISLIGARVMTFYVTERLEEHGADHTLDVLGTVAPLLEMQISSGTDNRALAAQFQRLLGNAQLYGIRLVLIDSEAGKVLADSAAGMPMPAMMLRQMGGRVPQTGGAGDQFQTVVLKERHQIPTRWRLGASVDVGGVEPLLDDIHWRVDIILISAGGAIALLGFLALRGVGRRYEAELEREVEARTRELEQTHAQLLDQERLAAVGKTASVMAHEMRNPMASIKLALSGIGRREVLDSRDQRRLDMVLGEVERLETLLSESLEYARPVVLSTRRESLVALVERVIANEEPLLQEHQLKVSLTVDGDPPVLCMDEAKIQQMLLNLLRNAIEASGVERPIEIRLCSEPEQVVIEVSNWGAPIPVAIRDQIFEPFFTTRANGTGLGLSLARQVVEAHRGSIAVDSGGERTCFRIELPIRGPECGEPLAVDGATEKG